MESCENQFIINLEYILTTEQSLYFILPFISGGDLLSILKSQERFSEDEIKFYST